MALTAMLPFRHHPKSRFDLSRFIERRSPGRTAGRLAGEIAIGAATLAAGGFAAYFIKERSQEEAEHTTIERDGAFSLRRYSPRIVAEVSRYGRLTEAMDEGFKALFDYIAAKPGGRAEGARQDKIAMAVPVSVAPAKEQSGDWLVRFTLPRAWTRDRLPEPGHDIKLVDRPARTIAAVRFGGRGTDFNLVERQRQALLSWIRGRGLVAQTDPEFAAYNAPIVPGLLRRNEWWVEVDDSDVRASGVNSSDATAKVHKTL